MQRSQGKWYPGEPLPRWQIALFWRADGEPIWRRPELLADPWESAEDCEAGIAVETSGPDPAETGDPAPAQKLLTSFAESLGLPVDQVMAAFEDPLVRMGELAALPPGRPSADPTVQTARAAALAAVAAEAGDEDLDLPADSSAAREALLARLDAAVTEPTAYVLPLSRSEDGTAWQSARWTMRRGRLVLTPGTSPAGLRLPLNSLSWGPAPTFFEADPSARPDDLPDDPARALGHRVVPADPEEFLPRTALVAEVRGGRLHVFMPPTSELEEFLSLIHI